MVFEGNCEQALKMYNQSIGVTPLMAYKAINYVKEWCSKVECIVAPYEADAQLAYLSKIDYVQGVITEDSDLIVFGAKRILYKLNNDYVQEFRLEKFTAVF
jgi:exonuclease-1